MSRKRHTAEQIIRKLREAEIELAKGQTTADVIRKLGITEQTYYRWRKEYRGLGPDGRSVNPDRATALLVHAHAGG